MMADPHNFSPSELIDLFIDNEADAAQQAVLFAALSNNDDLQAEFAEAMRIRSAIEQDRSDVLPPQEVVNSLFARAGMTPPAAAVAPAAVRSGGDKNKKRALPLPLVLAGGLLTGALLMFLWLGGGQAGDSGVSSAAVDAAAQNPAAAASDSLSSRIAVLSGALQSTTAERDTLKSDNHGLRRALEASRTELSQRESELREALYTLAADARAWARSQEEAEAAANDASAELNDADVSTVPEAAAPRETLVLARLRSDNVPVAARISAAEFNKVVRLRDAQWPPMAPEFLDGLSFEIRGFENLEWYPLRTIGREKAGPWFNNMSLGVLFKLNDNWAVGVEGGQETFPLYVADNSPAGFSLQNRIWWMGASLQSRLPLDFMPLEIDWLNQLSAGGSRSGPFGRMYSALSWRAAERVSFNLGADGSLLLYELDGQVFTAARIGAAYGISISF